MNTIEERIRAAARAAADTVPPDSVPPLRLPAGSPSRFRRGRRDSRPGAVWVRRLAPVAAALAVVAVAVSVVTISRSRHAPVTSTGTAAPGGVRPGPPISTYVRSGQVPPYYVAIHGDPNVNPSYAVVQATVSGKTLATINPPTADGTIVAVTAAADDRTFVLSVQPRAPRGGDQAFEASTFYMVRLSSSGQPGRLTKLPMSVPTGALVTGLALSPSGRKLAIAVEPNNGRKTSTCRKSGSTRSAPGRCGPGRATATSGPARATRSRCPGPPTSGRWRSTGIAPAQEASGCSTSTPAGSSLLADSRLQTRFPAPSPYGPACQNDLIITPDGSAVVCGAIQASGVDLGRGAVTEFREYSTATGKIVRVFGYWTFPKAGVLAVNVLWSNPSGSLLIGVIPTTGDGRVGVISGNTFTPLPAQGNSTADQSGPW